MPIALIGVHCLQKQTFQPNEAGLSVEKHVVDFVQLSLQINVLSMAQQFHGPGGIGRTPAVTEPLDSTQ